MSLAPEQTILNGKYRILRLIGEGGMARVWLAAQPHLGGLPVAIKEPHAGLSPEEQGDLLHRWRREVQLCAALERARVPHTVRTITLELLPDGTQLLVLDHLEGGSLAELIAAHPSGLPIDRALALTVQVLGALEGLHRLPAAPVHRDVKPENILLDQEGRAHLGDFGLAQLPGQSGRSQMLADPHPGTPLYMAPEQARSPEPLTPAADLYALGCVLFEMLTGQRYKRLRPGTRAAELRPEVPAWLDRLLARVLADSPWDRPQSAADIARALEAGRAGTETDGQGPRGPRRWQVWAAALAALAAAAALLIWVVLPLLDSPTARLLRPQPGSRVLAGEPVVLEAEAGGARDLVRLELTADGQPACVGTSAAAAGQGSLACQAAWTFDSPGFAVISAVAFTAGGRRSRPASVELAVAPAQPTPTAADRPAPAPPTATVAEAPTAPVTPTQEAALPTPLPGSAEADQVIAFNPGPGAGPEYGDPQALLGAPDLVEAPCCRGMVQLGRGGSVLLAFADNSAVDGPGADLQVFGESVRDDFLLVEVSADGWEWAAFPAVSESPGALDLAEVRLDRAVYVRLTDLQPGTPTGAEVDAVAALNSGPAPDGRLPDLPDAVARSSLALYEGESSRMKVAGRLPAGTALTLLGRGAVAGWVKAQAGEGISGWCPSAGLALNVSLSRLARVAGPATPAPPQPRAGDAQTRERDGMVMLYVPAGSFLMGSAADDGQAQDDEKPQHAVSLGAFWIDRTEVTNAQYRAFVSATGHREPTTCAWGEPTYADPAKRSHPVGCVSWADAQAYCAWAGARLPSEAEWEKAARGTDARIYPWGDAFDGTRANYCDESCEFGWKDGSADDGYARTAPVGSYAAGASPYGVLDLSGNVWEWVGDRYDAAYYRRSPARDPQGPASGSLRVMRGGSFNNQPGPVRPAQRNGYDPLDRSINIGFRCGQPAAAGG